MSFTTFNKEVWATNIQGLLKNASVANTIANRNVVPSDAGDKFHILGISDVSVADYTQGSGLTYADPTGTDTEFTFNVDKVVPLIAYDKDVKQASADWQMIYADRAGYKLRDAFDSAVFGDHASWTANNYETGTTEWTVGATGAQVPEFFASVVEAMDTLNLPQDGRYIVLPPKMRQAINLWLAGKGSNFGDSVSANGFAGSLFGLDVFITNNLTTATNVTHCPAGVKAHGLATADLISPEDVEVLRDPAEYANYIRTRLVAGYKVYKGAEIIDVNVSDAPLA